MDKHLKPVRITWRFILLLIHALVGFVLAVPILDKSIRPGSFAARLTLWWHRRVCRILGVRVTVDGRMNSTPTLFVVNHISWFDIPALGSQIPVHFLSKDEVNSWPIIGWFAQRTGTLFIKRGAHGAAQQSIADIRQVLQQGNHVIIFPEGTTTDGSSVRRFHSRLLQAAIDAGVQVQALALTYPHPGGVHPNAPFIGDTQLLESSLAMMSERRMDANITFLSSVDARQYNRDQLAQMTENEIRQLVEARHRPRAN
jgi:1-acyl-sn-glycerol-3-phosphate acyltransferase